MTEQLLETLFLRVSARIICLFCVCERKPPSCPVRVAYDENVSGGKVAVEKEIGGIGHMHRVEYSKHRKTYQLLRDSI